MGDQGIDQGAVGIAGRRMHHQPRRLVDDDQVLVLVDHVERNILALRAWPARRAARCTLIGLARFDPVVGVFYRLRVAQRHRARFQQLLKARAGEIGQSARPGNGPAASRHDRHRRATVRVWVALPEEFSCPTCRPVLMARSRKTKPPAHLAVVIITIERADRAGPVGRSSGGCRAPGCISSWRPGKLGGKTATHGAQRHLPAAARRAHRGDAEPAGAADPAGARRPWRGDRHHRYPGRPPGGPGQGQFRHQ